jgi:hypothetical protein
MNLVTLAPSLHALWTKAHFALRPVDKSPDNKSLTVQFVRLPKYDRSSSIDILQKPVSLSDYKDVNGWPLYNAEVNRFISSGDLIVLETDDPKLRPLPSMELLDMQWVLHRLTAMSAAAEPRDLDEEDDEEDPFREES